MSDFVALRATGRLISVAGDTCIVFEWHHELNSRSTRTLLFESESAVRVVTDYPASWRELSDDALYALVWRRKISADHV
jgi:hypothetical protein